MSDHWLSPIFNFKGQNLEPPGDSQQSPAGDFKQKANFKGRLDLYIPFYLD